ncbi:MAG TPA: hypothetical protein ENN46_04680 [Candidatus Woesearchaeota archaeon]|mgnify:CR=1 FL=1|nr:hypothetical protein [Candidatus Woesearchaeota archaeon]
MKTSAAQLVLILLSAGLFLITTSSGAGALDYTSVSNADIILINTRDWQASFSAMQLASILSKPTKIIFSDEQMIRYINTVRLRSVLVIQEGRKSSQRIETLLRGKGTYYTVAGKSDLEGLFQDMYETGEIKGFYVVPGNDASFSLVSLASALREEKVHLFAESQNINDIIDSVSGKECRVVALSGTDWIEQVPCGERTIKDTKYDLSIFFSEKILSETETRQIIITDGRFIEQGFFQKSSPVVLIGKSFIPESIEKHIAEEEQIEFIVLVGNEIIPLVSALKTRIENTYKRSISFIVRFGKTSAEDDQISALDIIFTNLPEPQLALVRAIYNTVSEELILSLREEGNVKTFAVGSVDAEDSGQEQVQASDENPFEIMPGETITRAYALGLEDIAEAIVSFLYGETPQDFDKKLEFSHNQIQQIEIEDFSEIGIEKAIYIREIDAFVVYLKNSEESRTYARGRISSLNINGQDITVASMQDAIMAPGESGKLIFRAKMDTLDFEANPQVQVTVFYGSRSDLLFKEKTRMLNYSIKLIRHQEAVLISGLLAAFAIMLIFLRRRKKKKLKMLV